MSNADHRNSDPTQPAALFRQVSGSLPAVVAQHSGTGPAISGQSASGDLLELKDAAGTSVYRVTQSGGVVGAASTPTPAAGQYVWTSSPGSVSTSNTQGAGSLRLVPWIVERALTLDRIGAEVTVIGDVDSKFRLGIYADNGHAYPGALLLDAGQIAGDAVAVAGLTCAVDCPPGLYWIGGAVQAVVTTQPTLRVVSTNWTPPVVLGTGTAAPTAGQVAVGYAQTAVTGALPATFTTTVALAPTAVRVHVRAA